MENMTASGLQFFRELPKEQRKALQTEYFKSPEARKSSRTFIIVAVIFAVVVIAFAVIGVLTKHDSLFATFPAFLICIWPAVISQQKFEKWLETEKNITMRRPKQKS